MITSKKTLRWFLGAALGGALCVAPSAFADDLSDEGGAHIGALCQSWMESPCILRVAGTLRSATSGVALEGMRLRFVSRGEVICSSLTDANGRASCYGIVDNGRTVAERGYRIEFDGDDRFDPEISDGISLAAFGGAGRHSD